MEKRDGGLIAGQEKRATEIAGYIKLEIIDKGVKVIVFCVSPKKRAIQTVNMISSELRSQTSVHIIQHTEEGLRDQYQGEILLPDDYKSGDHFEGLALAGKIFRQETFGDNYLDDNITYGFGDPLLQTDGTYKYPELKKYFLSSGESYRDVMVRLLKVIINFSKRIERFQGKVSLVVITHSQVCQIIKDLEIILRRYKDHELAFDVGQLGRTCWDIYKKRKADGSSLGNIDFVSVDSLVDESIIRLLQKEIDYLQKI